jgi:hypothetical protein
VANKLYYFAGRNTPVVASSEAAARKKCKRGCGALVKTRSPTASENKTMARGGWVRSRASGKAPPSKGVVKSGGSTGYGPSRKAIAKAKRRG